VCAGTTFAINAIMPSWTGDQVEDIVHGIIVVALVYAIVFRGSSNSGGDRSSFSSKEKEEEEKKKEEQREKAYETMMNLQVYTSWRVSKRLADMTYNTNLLQVMVIIFILFSLLKAIQPHVGPAFIQMIQDLLVLVSVYRLANAVLHNVQNGNSSDASVLLIAGLCIIRIFMQLFL
jgi:hypothetical protein